MRFHTENPTIYDGIMGWDDALIAAAVTAAASAGSAYMANESRQDAQSAQQSYNFTANANANEIMAAQAGINREFSNSQRGLQNQFGFDQSNLAYERNQANYEDQKRFASSAYQRAMIDMRQAGLNPILAYSKGGLEMTPQPAQAHAATPGGTPSGSSGSSSSPLGTSLPQVEGLLGGGAISSAVQSARAVADVQQTVANTRKTEQDTLLSAAQERQSNAATALQAAQAVTEGVRPENVRAGTRLLGAQTTLAGANTGESLARTARVPSEITLNMDQAGRANADRQYLDTQRGQRETYGPPGPVSSTVGGISQIIESIRQSLNR